MTVIISADKVTYVAFGALCRLAGDSLGVDALHGSRRAAICRSEPLRRRSGIGQLGHPEQESGDRTWE